MLIICIAEPVPETRELLTRLVTRRGDEPVIWRPGAGMDSPAPATLDLLLFEPLSSMGREARDHVTGFHGQAVRVAVTAAGAALPDDHGAHHVLLQPFSPDDLARVLDGAVLVPDSA